MHWLSVPRSVDNRYAVLHHCGTPQCPESGLACRPYTVNDCEIVYATRNADKYCGPNGSPNAHCSNYPDSRDFKTQLKEMGGAYARYKGNNVAWQKEYAAGHCKLNDLGAAYSRDAV